MPPDDPTSHQLMRWVDGKRGWSWQEHYGTTRSVENPYWTRYLPRDEQGRIVLDRAGAVGLALIHSREYQQELEDLYLSALDVSFERFQFDTQFFGGNSTFFQVDGPVAGRGTSSSTLTTASSLEARRLFATGGQLVVEAANSVVWQFSGDDNYLSLSPLSASFVQPLLRGAGRAVVLENLTDSERALLANIRQMERFRRGFYLQTVAGRSPGAGPSPGRIGLGSLSPGGTGRAGGYLSLLTQELQIRNQRSNVAALRSSLEQLNAFYAAGQIPRNQVDQLLQRLYQSQISLLSQTNDYDNRLDGYKIELGLPPHLDVRLEDPVLDPFNLIDPALTETQEGVEEVLAPIRETWARIRDAEYGADQAAVALLKSRAGTEAVAAGDRTNAVRWVDEAGTAAERAVRTAQDATAIRAVNACAAAVAAAKAAGEAVAALGGDDQAEIAETAREAAEAASRAAQAAMRATESPEAAQVAASAAEVVETARLAERATLAALEASTAALAREPSRAAAAARVAVQSASAAAESAGRIAEGGEIARLASAAAAAADEALRAVERADWERAVRAGARAAADGTEATIESAQAGARAAGRGAQIVMADETAERSDRAALAEARQAVLATVEAVAATRAGEVDATNESALAATAAAARAAAIAAAAATEAARGAQAEIAPVAPDVLARALRQLPVIVPRVRSHLGPVEEDCRRLNEALSVRAEHLERLAARDEFRRGDVDPGVADVAALQFRVVKLNREFFGDADPSVRRMAQTLLTTPDEQRRYAGLPEAPGLANDLQTALNDLEELWRPESRAPQRTDDLTLVQGRLGLLRDLLGQLSDHLLSLSLFQARARLDTTTLTPVDLDWDEALEVARNHRRDWMNARAALVDQWRQIEVVANRLESNLDLTFDGDLTTRGQSGLVRRNNTTGSVRVGLAFDAPLTRLAERNAYRRALIAYQQARRQYYAYEDRVSLVLRDTLRTIRLTQLQFELNRAAAHTAIDRVEQERFKLREPLKPGQTAEAKLGPTAARDLADALASLLSQQNAFVNEWVNYEVLRMGLDFDLGTMELDAQGFWIDPGPVEGRGLGVDGGELGRPRPLETFPIGPEVWPPPEMLPSPDQGRGPSAPPDMAHRPQADRPRRRSRLLTRGRLPS